MKNYSGMCLEPGNLKMKSLQRIIKPSIFYFYIYEIFTHISLPLKKRMWWDRYENESLWTMFIIHQSNSTPEGKKRNRKLHPQLIFVSFFFRTQLIRLTKLGIKMAQLWFLKGVH